MTELASKFTEANAKALALYRRGQQRESERDLKGAVQLYSQAFKLNPLLETVS